MNLTTVRALGGITLALQSSLARCSQWMSDACLVCARLRDVRTFAERPNFEILLERLTSAGSSGAVRLPVLVAPTLLPGLAHRFGRGLASDETATLGDVCISCARWRTCRAWSQRIGDDSAYRRFCPQAVLLDALPDAASVERRAV